MHMSVNPEGPSGLALASLTEEQRDFLISIPKAELHAHLNGSIPLPVLQELALERIRAQLAGEDDEVVKKGIEILENGVELKRIDDFFSLFPAIYSLTCDVKTLAKAASSVLHSFLTPSPEYSQCAYLELRTTPRETPTMTRRVYVETVLAEIEKFSADRAALIVAIDRRMTLNVTEECVDIAIDLRRRGGRVVGIDLCGDPTVSRENPG
jgi:adenosine deaminase